MSNGLQCLGGAAQLDQATRSASAPLTEKPVNNVDDERTTTSSHNGSDCDARHLPHRSNPALTAVLGPMLVDAHVTQGWSLVGDP